MLCHRQGLSVVDPGATSTLFLLEKEKLLQEPLNRPRCCTASCLPTLHDFPQPSVNIAPVTVLSNVQCMNTPTGEYRHTELPTYTLVHLCQCVDVEIQLCNAASGNLLGLKLGLR